MIKQTLAAGAIALATSFAGVAAHAEDFAATPLQHGAPADLPGEHLIPGVAEAAAVVNGVTQPILQPILAPDGAAPAGAPVVHKGHHHRHHVAHRHVGHSHQASLRRRTHHVS